MQKYKITREARARLREIYHYTLQHYGRQKAEDYLASLSRCMNMLAEQPGLGHNFKRFKRYNDGMHSIFYRVDSAGITVLHIFHQSEDILTKLQ